MKCNKIATDFASLPLASLTYYRLFLAIQINGSAGDINTDAGNSRRKRSFACDIGKRRMRRSCVIIPPPPPPPPTESPFKVLVADNLGFDGKYFFPNQTPNYNMSMYESSCLYWDEENQTWTGHGCRVSTTSPLSLDVFSTNHRNNIHKMATFWLVPIARNLTR